MCGLLFCLLFIAVLCCTGPESPGLVAGEGRERELAIDYCVTLRVSPRLGF